MKKATCDRLQVALSGGGGNCTRNSIDTSRLLSDICENNGCPWSEMGRAGKAADDVFWQELSRVVEAWPSLPSHIVLAILALVRTAKPQGGWLSSGCLPGDRLRGEGAQFVVDQRQQPRSSVGIAPLDGIRNLVKWSTGCRELTIRIV